MIKYTHKSNKNTIYRHNYKLMAWCYDILGLIETTMWDLLLEESIHDFVMVLVYLLGNVLYMEWMKMYVGSINGSFDMSMISTTVWDTLVVVTKNLL